MSSRTAGKTKLCGIIGDPIEHTVSPVMHNAAFRELGLDYLYAPFPVKKADLGKTVAGMRVLNVSGFNVTLPHKVAIIPFLDKLDPLAENIGAVNTVVNKGGVLTGYNTDAAGFLRALKENGVEPKAKNMVIIGAGGAARAICFILAQNEASLTILNRQSEFDWAKELAFRLSRLFQKTKAVALSDKNLASALKGADVLINATSVGMKPNHKESPVPARLLKPGLVVSDIVYNPPKTRLLKEAEAAGAKTISGIDMLVWQGALAFEMWTGQKAPVELMKKEAIKALKHEN